ncbi:MAG: DUF2249 domain-containing protein [Deltaproteobacteria bacterium]|nr:DUF2249 domain-containing protein [Deltaproteobacteria bacterium]
MSAAAFPIPVSAAGARSAAVLDVRPVLASGGDPFSLILKTARQLADDEALHLVVGFEPAPLYAVMKTLGRSAHTEQADGAYHVWFYRDPRAVSDGAHAASEDAAPLQEPVELDVRNLEPPQPMIVILEKLVELGPGAQLLVRHHREPVLLYEKLELRGYRARTTKRGEGDYLVHIAPARVFQEA